MPSSLNRKQRRFKQRQDDQRKILTDILKVKGGLVPEKRLKRKDYIFDKAFPKDEIFGAVKLEHLGRLEEIAKSSLVTPPWYQGQLNACLVVSATLTNNYYSVFNSKNDVRMVWQDLWDKVPKYPQGTKLSEVLQILKDEGVKASDGKNYQINGYFKLADRSPAEVYRALQKAPVLIGFWTDEAGIEAGRFAHEIVAVDVNPEGTHWQCLNWWQSDKQEYLAIPIGTPLINAAIIYDADDFKDNLIKQKIRLGWGGFFKQFIWPKI